MFFTLEKKLSPVYDTIVFVVWKILTRSESKTFSKSSQIQSTSRWGRQAMMKTGMRERKPMISTMKKFIDFLDTENMRFS